MRGTLKTIVTLAVIGAALYFTNPTMADFGRYYEKKQVAAATKNAPEGLGSLFKAVAETGADLVLKLGYKRADYKLFSVYTLGSSDQPKERFLGFGKAVFIDLK